MKQRTRIVPSCLLIGPFVPVAIVVACAGFVGLAASDGALRQLTARDHNDCDCRPEGAAATSCCADDYCAKPLPCLPCTKNYRCPDDYCPKVLPQLCLPCKRTCPDDYCPKPFPPLRLPFCTPAHKCPPGQCDCR